MSRIGKKPINIPAGVTVEIIADQIKIKGPKGELVQKIHPLVKVEKKDDQIVLDIPNKDEKKQRALWGLFGALITNMVIGVTKGYQKQLEVNGVGYKVALQGKKLVLNLGYSHPIDYELPVGMTAEVEKNVITLSGCDKKLVGETAAQIRRYREPEPYKGKGIKYMEEILRRKAGKTAAKGE